MSATRDAAATPPGGATRLQAAQARLAASRQRLHAAWVPTHATPSPSGRGPARRLGAWWRLWRRRAADAPLLDLALQSVEAAWQQSPWRAAGLAMSDELGHAVRPWVRRHPVLTVALAAAAGGAMVALRPWAWPVVHRQLRLGPYILGRWLIYQLGRAPLTSILADLALQRPATPAARPRDPPSPVPSGDGARSP